MSTFEHAPVQHPVRLYEAAKELGLPVSTVQGWAKDTPTRRRHIHPIDRHPDGHWLYDMNDIRRVAGEVPRRKRRKRSG